MIKRAVVILYIVLSLIFLGYLILPGPNFPNPPEDAQISNEPADTESPLRRAYFTNATREEVMKHYKNEFGWGYRLNYPPEESQTIIRDQARSTFLEEVVHPFRESVFVNGFEPKEAKDAVVIDTIQWRQKITVRFVPSSLAVRLFVGVFTLVMTFILFREFTDVKKRN